MGSVFARTVFISRCWPSALAQIWKGMLLFRSYSDQGPDAHVPICQEASSKVIHSGESPQGASMTHSFRACGLVDDRHAYPVRKFDGYPSEAKRPVGNHDQSSRNVAQESSRSPRQGFVCGPELLPLQQGNIQLASPTTAGRAIAVLKNRQQQGLSIDSYALTDALKQCSQQKDLIATRQLHDCIIQSGMDKNPYVATTLLNVYIKCGRLPDARRVFDGILNTGRNVMTWNAMIGAYAKSGCGVEAHRLFLQMNREGFVPNAITCLSILNASASAGASKWVRDVHSHAHKAGLQSDVRVGNALVHMYAKSGSVDDARLVFNRLEKRDVITWNIMIGAYAESGCGVEAYRLFDRMKREGFMPDAITCLSILNPSASAGALEWVREVYSHVLEAGLQSDVRVGTALVRMYVTSGRVDDARLVFDRLEKRVLITWNVMIGAYAESGCGVEAYRLFNRMKREGFLPDAFTYVSILNASASAGALKWVREVHRHALKSGLESDVRVGNALVHMYAKSGSVDDARLLFDRLERRDVYTWNIMIGAYAEAGCGVEAYRLFARMKCEGFIPDAITCLSILNASASAGALEWVREVHSHALIAGLVSDVRVGNALVHMYAKCGSVDDARLVFDRLEKRDVITWNTMIGAYAESGCGVQAYDLFDRMKREGFIPGAITCLSVLNASATAGALEWVREVHSHALEAGLVSDVRVGTALVRMYAKSGSVDDARLVFDRLEKRDVITWNVMVGGLAQHGRGHEALELFKRMSADCVKPDGSSFVAILSACSHAGLVNDGRRLFTAMKQDYGVEATIVHYNCMVDALGRAGHLEEAKLFIDNMPMEPDAVTWKALLGACRTHSSVELGEVAAKEVLKLEPKASAAYVLLSNIYASTGMWEKVVSVRNMMEKRGVWKEPGRSWIAVDGKIHEFVVGDTSHPEATAIYNTLEELTENLKAKGYIPDTRLVLLNINDEDKELALCSHSEKLAIAYGLLRVPREEAIRVWKNLRICSDCHTATKLISEATGRDIIAKDANRFHHFKDGVCSCGDYW